MKLPLFPRTQITHPPEYKGKPKLYPIVYPPQPLMKASFKQLKQMFPNTNEHDHVLKWAADNIKHNDLQALYLRHYKQNPQVHTEENKNKLGHINGMMDISSEMKNVKIDKNDTLESAFKKYDDAEHTWRQGNGVRYIEAEGKPVVDFGDGWAWFDLGRPTCEKEGAAMGHCGNTGDPHPDDRILSLRKIVKVGDKIFHEPALTFINNHGWLGEMKGRANSKPAQSYHKRIVELLKHPDIKGMVGAGYMPENNFHFDDLSPEHKNQVRMSNPNLVDLRSDDWDDEHKNKAAHSVPDIQKYSEIVKKIFKTNKLKKDIDSGKININSLDADNLILLKNHRLFDERHIEKIIKDNPDDYLSEVKNHILFNQFHINSVIEKNAFLAVKELANRLQTHHIDNIVQKDPEAAFFHFNYNLKNHPLLNASHIQTIAENNPKVAAQYLYNHPLLNASHIQTIAENNPEAAARFLHNHSLFNQNFNANQIDSVVQNHPRTAAIFLNKHPLFNAKHIQTIVQKDPLTALQYLNHYPLLYKLFNQKDIDNIVKYDPFLAAGHLYDHPLINEKHIDYIVNQYPERAAQFFKNNPIYQAKYGNKVQKSLQKSQQLEKVLVSSEPSEGVLKIAKYDGMRPNETHVSTTRVPHERFGSVYVHHFESDDGTNARHLVSMHHDPHQAGVSVLLAARQNEDKPMTVYAAATHPDFQGNRLNYVALREAVKSHGTLHSDVMQSMPAFKNWNRLKQEAGFKVNITKPYREPSAEDASMLPHIAQYSKQTQRIQDMEKAVTPEQQKENIKKQRELKNKEIIAKLKSKVVDKAPKQEASIQPRLLMSEDDSPAGIPIYLKTHPSHDNLAGVHVHINKLPSLENYGILDEPKVDRALDTADARGHSAVYVSVDQTDEPKKPKLQLVKSKLAKALWPSDFKYENLEKAKKTPHNKHTIKRINFSSNTEKLRKLRDIAEANGGIIHPKQLIQHGLNENVLGVEHLKDAKGNYSAQAVQNHIDSLPKHSYNFSETTWEGDQRHTNKPQNVFQLNITPEIIEKLKNENVFNTFQLAHKILYSRNHPVNEDTLGWVRFNEENNQHHIDEIQSDFGHNNLNRLPNIINKFHELGKIDDDTKTEFLQWCTPDKLKKMHNTLFNNQHPSKLIHEAFLQHMRDKGKVGSEFHIWQAIPKAELAGQEVYVPVGFKKISKIAQIGKMIEENKLIDLPSLDFLASNVLSGEKWEEIVNKHKKDDSLNEEAYRQDIINHPIIKHVINYIKNNQEKIDKDKQEPGNYTHTIPLTVEHLPVHMKFGYEEVPPKMDYTKAKYGDAAPQKNWEFRGQPTWKTTLRKSVAKRLFKALLSKPPQVEYGRYTQPFSMGATKKEKKTIYSHFDHPEHANFNAQEHLDAYWRHQEKIKQNPEMESSLVNFHKKQAQMHWDKSRDLVDKGDTSRQIG